MTLNIIHDLFPDESPKLDTVLERTKHTMKAYIISLMNDHESTVATRKLLMSIVNSKANVDPFVFNAVTPRSLPQYQKRLFGQTAIPNIKYTYPLAGEKRYDMRTGLQLSGYPTKDINKRISCFVSHYNLWKLCIEYDEPIMILEQDAMFTSGFDYGTIKDKFTGDILGLNNAIGATRLAGAYDSTLKEAHKTRSKDPKKPGVYEAPWVDKNRMVPQGIAGNSAYIIKPTGAEKLITLTAENGIWPNDAMMCKQLMPGKLQHIYPYVTKVQGGRSTTSE